MSCRPVQLPKDFVERPPIADNTIKAIPVYFESKRAQENTIKRYPEWDSLHGEPVIELMRVCREFRIADADWLSKREAYKTRKADHDRKWEELREKEKQLRLNFVKFDTFIKDNLHKRQRAEAKIKDQKELQKIREAEILEFETGLAHLENIRSRMQSCVEEYQPFKKYLELVVQSSTFSSIAAVFNRYETLIDVKKSLHRNQAETLKLLESTTLQLQKMTEEKSQNLMDLNSRLAHLQSRHRRAQNEALHWELMVSRIKELAGSKELNETLVRGCIWNLYRQVCKRKGIPMDAKREDLEGQLLMIKRTIVELRKIVAETKRRATREKKLAEKSMRQRGGSEVGTNTLTNCEDTRSSIRSSCVENT